MSRKKWCKYCKQWVPGILFDRKYKYDIEGFCKDCTKKLANKKKKDVK